MSLTPKLLQQGAAGSARANYIEDVFSTYLYTGNGSTQTITNGIDLSTKGGLVWSKDRAAGSHWLIDTIRGRDSFLVSNNDNGQTTGFNGNIASFNSNGYSLTTGYPNTNAANYVSWTFRKQPKFFDVVTYTGNGSSLRSLSHSLGSEPGFIVVKKTSGVENWGVYHRSLPAAGRIVYLNLTFTDSDGYVGFTPPTSSIFYVGGGGSGISGGTVTSNENGATYVAYLFAHNAGGFGVSGNDNVISCGSYTGTGAAGNAITLGYEPQWLMIKRTDAANVWHMQDIMRGSPVSGGSAQLYANQTNAEFSSGANPEAFPTATGFTLQQNTASVNATGGTYIYIAIRRGPMKVPTTGTSVYNAIARTGTSATATVTGVGFSPDLTIIRGRDAGYSWRWGDRLRGTPAVLRSNLTYAELTGEADLSSFDMNGISLTGTGPSLSNGSGGAYINHFFRRAPGFFDEVCYTGTYLAPQTHKLGVAPELVIFKNRTTGVMNWIVKSYPILGNSQALVLNSSAAAGIPSGLSSPPFAATPDTATIFYSQNVAIQEYNFTTDNYVAYLFATCPGVSKVGSYTGNGSSQTIDCGFAAGARFVLIKRTDSTGDWYTFDTVRGIIAGNDPFLFLNATSAEVTSYDAVDPANSGFIVNNDATNFPINVASATYIFLAIA